MKVDPSRLIGLAAMPALGIEAAIAEMERCLKLGFSGVWLNTVPVASARRSAPRTIRSGTPAQTNGVAVHFHVRVMRKVAKPKPKGKRGDDLTGLANVGAADMITDMPEIISSGVHDRFPNLKWVAVETGSGWIPYILEQLDDRWWRNRALAAGEARARAELLLPPQLALRRSWSTTTRSQNRHVLGVDNLMWSTDYPHHGCDWPQTRKTVDEMFRRPRRGALEDDRRQRGEALRSEVTPHARALAHCAAPALAGLGPTARIA